MYELGCEEKGATEITQKLQSAFIKKNSAI